MRGDEYQQMCVCAMLIKKLKAMEAQCLIKGDAGIVVIPSAAQFSMNVGYNLGETTQRLADSIFTAVRDYDYGIQLASYHISGDFVPHVRSMQTGFQDNSIAADFGVAYNVIREPQPIDTTTLNYNWQVFETCAFSLYSGPTSRVDVVAAEKSVEDILRFLKKRGVISAEAEISDGEAVIELNENELVKVLTHEAGFLHKLVKPGDTVEEGQVLAEIIDPYEAEKLEELKAPCKGIVFFSRVAEVIAQNEIIFSIKAE
ncbi:unnamed protein product [Cylicocyclus nassatus]|uniref:Uncharacterized protein n=1 Tax=Cylicocyclus nassatus TaxID=53992 RepID=A0AA36GZ21_CYLNA|nr:unnamed protein product [Cylicocyclus nassatus]